VTAAAEEVGRAVGAEGIAGLVNNAGIGVTRPMEAIPADVLRKHALRRAAHVVEVGLRLDHRGAQARAAPVGHPRRADRAGVHQDRGARQRALALIARWAPDPVFDRIRIRLFGLPRRFGARRAEDVTQPLTEETLPG
jgi:NAD(P)-dependent dehydrogenase (short-subunit alcohol dehydrogenase family)